MDAVLYVVGAAGFLVALLTTLALNWKLHTENYSLQDRVSLLEGIVQREVKVRAASERWSRAKAVDQAIETALETPLAVPPKKVPWFKKPEFQKRESAG